MISDPVILVAMACMLSGLCLFALLQTARTRDRGNGASTVHWQKVSSEPAFLFRGSALIDATPRAQRLLETANGNQPELDQAMDLLCQRFPKVRDVLTGLSDNQNVTLKDAQNPEVRLEISRDGELTRLRFKEPETTTGARSFDQMQLAALENELTTLRALTAHSPHLIWKEDQRGQLLWANGGYLDAADSLRPRAENQVPVWPEAPVFPDLGNPSPADKPAVSRRHAIRGPADKADRWFDVTSIKVGADVLHYASDANPAVKAEAARQAFMQTLAKTFAQLSIGLAIFDKRRQLSLFNPALQEMTGLPITFLSARPSIEMVMDQLRESRKLPEPRDYSSWREQFRALEVQAKNGTYAETWDMPDGQTLRVTGRPHPDGALAFLFEDISAEVSLTRRFRTEIETGQSVLDSLSDAIAVFSPAQTLVMMNVAYSDLWEDTNPQNLAAQDLQGALRIWKASCAPTRLWKGIEEFNAKGSAQRHSLRDNISLLDGRRAACMAKPLPGGMTMIRFTLLRPGDSPLPKLVPQGDNVRQSGT